MSERDDKDKEQPKQVGTTSATLIEKARHGSEESRNTICNLYKYIIFENINKVPLYDRDEVYQTVIISINTHVSTFNHKGPGSFRAWVRSICKKRQADYFRRLKRAMRTNQSVEIFEIPELSTDQSENNDIHNNLELKLLVNAIFEKIKKKVKPNTFEAARRALREEGDISAIAHDLNMTKNNVTVAKYRVLTKFREEWLALGEDGNLLKIIRNDPSIHDQSASSNPVEDE